MHTSDSVHPRGRLLRTAAIVLLASLSMFSLALTSSAQSQGKRLHMKVGLMTGLTLAVGALISANSHHGAAPEPLKPQAPQAPMQSEAQPHQKSA